MAAKKHFWNRRTVKLAGALGVSLALGLAACSSGSTGTEGTNSGAGSGASKRGDTLTVAALTPPLGFDPAYIPTGYNDNVGIEILYEPLIRKENDGKLAAGLATKWEFTDDKNRVFKLTLRKGAKFSDGEPVTADAVVASLKYIIGTNGTNASALKPISSVEAPDDNTVVVKTSKPYPVLPEILTQRNVAGDVISPAGVKNPSKLKTTPAGAGPYVLDAKNTVTNNRYTFIPNTNYYDQSRIHYNKIVLTVADNSLSIYNAIRAGQVDFGVGGISTAKSAENSDVHISTSRSYYGGMFVIDREGKANPPLAYVRVRQALNYAIDREAIAKAVFGKYGSATSSMTSPASPVYSKELVNMYSYDPDKAKQLLKEAGYPDGITLTLSGCSLEARDCPKIQQAMVSQLEAAGIKVEASNAPDYDTWQKQAMTKKYGLEVMSFGTSNFIKNYQDWAGGVASPFSNPFASTNDKAQAIMDKAKTTEDEDARNKLYNEALSQLTKDGWFLTAVSFDQVFLSSDKVGGVPDKFDINVPSPTVTEFYPK